MTTTTSRARAAALLISGLAVTAAGALTALPADAAVPVTGTLPPKAGVTLRTPGAVKFCLTNRGPSAIATVRVAAARTETIRVSSRVCTSVSTFGRLTFTNVSVGVGGKRASSVGYTVYGAGVRPL